MTQVTTLGRGSLGQPRPAVVGPQKSSSPAKHHGQLKHHQQSPSCHPSPSASRADTAAPACHRRARRASCDGFTSAPGPALPNLWQNPARFRRHPHRLPPSKPAHRGSRRLRSHQLLWQTRARRAWRSSQRALIQWSSQSLISLLFEARTIPRVARRISPSLHR